MDKSGRGKCKHSWERWVKEICGRIGAVRVLVSLLIALFLVAANYLFENYPFPLFDEIDSLGLTEFYVRHSNEERQEEEPLYFNVGYDKVLVPVTDSFGDTVGHTMITDRAKLLELLRIARTSKYKFLVLDVRFEPGLYSEADSALWAEMSGLPNFAYSIHENTADAVKGKGREAGANSDYGATLTTGFSRWELYREGGKTMPLRMYEVIDKGKIEKRGLLYFDRGRLCRNSPFIPLSFELGDSIKQNHEERYPLLGGEVMRWNDEEEIARMMDNRIVIVGDFENDVHDTYVGSVPGPAIIYSTYEHLHRGGHLVNWWLVIVMIGVYTVAGYWILSGRSIWDGIPAISRRPIVKFILSFIGWDLFFTVLNILIYIILKESYVIILPAFVFTLLGNYVSSKSN